MPPYTEKKNHGYKTIERTMPLQRELIQLGIANRRRRIESKFDRRFTMIQIPTIKIESTIAISI